MCATEVVYALVTPSYTCKSHNLSCSCRANGMPFGSNVAFFTSMPIGQHDLNNKQCALHYNDDRLCIPAQGSHSFNFPV